MRLFAGLLIGCLGLAACGGDDDDPPPDPVVPSTTQPVYRPPAPGTPLLWGTTPFPSDLALDDTGHLALGDLPVGPEADEAAVGNLLDSLSDLDGAGVRTQVYFPFDGDVDPTSLDARAHLVDLADGTELPVESVWHPELGMVVIAVADGGVLLAAHRYAAYIERGLLGAEGLPVVPDAALIAALEEAQPELFALVPAADIVTSTVFTTESVADVAVAMRDVAMATVPTAAVTRTFDSTELADVFGDQEADAPPGNCHDPFTNPRAQPHGNVGWLLHGTLDLPSFLSADPALTGFHTTDGGVPVVKARHTVPFTLTLPAPGTGCDLVDLPVVVYTHGLDRTRADILPVADTAAQRCLAVVAIDNMFHGSRNPGGYDTVINVTRQMVPDGFGDELDQFLASGMLFHFLPGSGIDALHPRAFRENFRQAGIDLVSLITWVTEGDLAPIRAAIGDDTLTFRNDVALMGESVSGVFGGIVAAIDPRVSACVLTAPAAGLPFPTMVHSPVYSEVANPALFGQFDIQDRIVLGDPVHGAQWDPMIMLLGWATEQGDSLAYAPYVLSGELRGDDGPSVLIGEMWGDEYVPNLATERYARALGLPRVPITLSASPPGAITRFASFEEESGPVSGNVGAEQTAAFTVWYPGVHAFIRQIDGQTFFESDQPPFTKTGQHPWVRQPITRFAALWGGFVADQFTTGVPTVFDPPDVTLPGGPCPQ